MYNQENPTEKLTEWLLSGQINDKTFEKAKKEVEKIKVEKAKRKQEAAEKRRLQLIEDNKPCNAIPRLSRYEHVPEHAKIYREYIENCDIALLEVYRDELVEGKHRIDYKNDVHFQKVLMFLTLKINMRKAGQDPTQEKNRLLREAKKEREELKEKLSELTQDAENAKAGLEAAQTLINQEKTKGKTPPTYVT